MENSSQLNKSPLIEQPSGFDTKKYIARKERQAEMRDQRLGVDVGTTASQRILDKAFMNTPLRVNLGMEARPSQGMLGELGTGIARGTFTTVRGVANTLEELTGNDGPGTMSYGMDRWARTHQGTFVGQPAYEGITDWSAGMIGEQVPFMASLLISGGTTGAIAKGMQLGMGAAKTLTTAGAMATVSAIQYGDNVDGIRKAANGKLSESQIHAMGALSTVVQSALEVALGPDAKILDATVMNAVRKSARPAAEMIALTAGGKGLFKSARNYFGSIAAESFTEFSQSITQSIFEDMSAGPGTQMSKEDFAEAFQAALAAVPSSALFGGFGMHAQWRERQKMLDVLKGLENDKSAIDLRAKTEEEKLARQQRTNAAFDTFKGKLSEKFGETGAEAITATVEVAAYHWAVERGLNPEDYINTFGMLFSNTTLSQQQQIELKKIESEEGRIQWMRNNVQGYREFEASEKDGYVADAFGKQFAVELDEYSALFGRGVFEGLLNEIGTAQDESIEANKNRETAPTPQEMTDQAAKRRADAVLNLYNLRQLALDAVADTKMEGDHIKLASLTRQSSSDMFKAIINPGENTSWIKPENMRRTLANLIYINNDNISREDAHATVQKLSTTKREGMKYSELEAYFLYEAGIDEMNNNDGTMFSSDEIVEALRVIKDNEDAWNKVVSQELGEYSYQAMLDAADAAGASAAQKARIVINHARNMRQRSLENAAEIWKMRDASEIKMSEDDAVAVSEFESEARKIDDLISKIEQAILEKANINTILEIANIKTIPRLTEELDRAVTDLFAMNYKIEEGAVRALRATEQEKADSISAAQEARLVINRSLNIPKKSSFLIQELNKLRDNSTTPLSEEETEAISVIESVSSKLSALISETEKAIREDGDAETILSLSAKVKRAESDLSVKNGMFETHIVQVMKDVADKEIRNAADAEGASVVQKALLALNHAFNMSYKGQVKLTSEQAREWKRAKKSTVDLVGKPRKNTKPTVDGRTDVNEINVYTENLLDRISYLSADLRESMQRAENNIEIAKLTDELNEAISELSGYVSVVEEGLASELKQAMGFDPNKQAPLRSEAETKVYAEYNIKKKIAVFYANATAEDVIHEWFHHVDTNNLLPEKLRDAMNEKYGINTDSSSTEIRNAREKAARDFVKYIAHVSGKDMDYPEELEEAFAYLREVFAAGLHAEQGIPDGTTLSSGGLFVGDDVINKLGYYSALERAVNGIKQESFKPDQLAGTVRNAPGVKAEELDDLGFFDWLDGVEGKVTKAQALEFIRNGGPQIQEVVKGDNSFDGIPGYDAWFVSDGDVAPYTGQDFDGDNAVVVLADTEEEALAQAESYDSGNFDNAPGVYTSPNDLPNNPTSVQTKFGQYQLPGGKNYREVLLTLPEEQVPQYFIAYKDGPTLGTGYTSEADALTDMEAVYPDRTDLEVREGVGERATRGEGYRSSHWEDPNVLVHMRLNDRVDADGKRVLFIEEIQSDWHQTGRKKGYAYKTTARDGDVILEEIDARMRELGLPDGTAGGSVARRDAVIDRLMNELESPERRAELERQRKSIPDAPFKKSWSLLAFKRVLKMAVDAGYDSVAWTPGEVQAERYDLSKQIDRISLTKRGDRFDIDGVYSLDGKLIYSDMNIPADDYGKKGLEDVVGKELADRIVEDAKTKENKEGWDYSGLDLKVGSEGMKGFYDKILPSEVGKYVKKMGGKVGTTQINSGESLTIREQTPEDNDSIAGLASMEPNSTEVWTLPITDQMRGVIEQGQPLYSDQSGKYKPEVREFFKGLLDGVTGPDWRQEMMAKIIARSMENDPPQTSEYEPPLQSSNMMNVTDPNSLRNAAHKMNKGGVAKGDGKTTHGKFFEDAYKKITGKDYEQGGWENLSLPNKQLLAQMAVNAYQETHQSYTMEELDAAAQAFNVERFADLDEKTKKQIRNSFESHRRAATSKNLDDVAKTFHMDAIRKAANNALGEFIPEARAIARLNPEIRRRERGERGGEVGWMDSFGSGVSSGYKKFEAWVKAKTFDFDAMIDYLDDGKKDGPVKRLLLDPLRKGVQKWAEARHETDKWLIEAGETHGAMPEVNDWKKEYYFGIEKKKLSVRQALFIYMYTDKGRAKDETKTLFESNKVKLGNDIDSVMTDVIQLVEGWGFGKDKGFVRWVQKKGVNDYRHSLKEREGWTKTYPLRNYARAQMDYMKRIYPELNRVHLERTGRELGNLFKGKDGKTREFIAPSMRMGQSWAHGKGLTDLFVANEEERTALVREVYGKKYGTDVTFDKLSDEEQKAIYALEEDLHVEESGISKRRTNARSQLVGSLESRTKGFTESEILMDAPFIFERYRDQANIYRTKYNIIDYLDAITRHGEFRETIRALVGDDRLDRIHNAIREMITRERFSGGRNYVDDDFDRLVSDVQGRVLPAVLMGRISTQAMQLTSAPRALAELPFRDHLKFFSNSLKIMGQLGTNIGRIGDVISMRHNPFFGDTEVGQWMQHMLESNPEILTRMYDPNVADYYESGQQRTGAGAIKVGRSNLADVALSGLRWMDMAAVLLVYQTCYESKVAELKRSRNQMTDAQIEKAAVDHAAHVVQITQIASTTTDRNLIQTARPTVRMWFPFTGDLMKQFTYINRQIVAPLARGWRDGKFEGVLQAMFVPGNQYGNQPAFKRILYFGLLPMTMVSLIKRRRPPESWEEWREDMLGLSVSTIPLIGPIFQNAITSNYQIDGTPIAMMPVMSLSKALRSLGKDGLIGEDGYVNEYGLEELGRAVLSGNGLPVVFVPFASEFCKMMLGSDAFTPEEKTIIERVLRVLSLSQAPTSAEK